MNTKSSPEDVVRAVSDQNDADVIFYNGPIGRPFDQLLIDACISRARRENVVLMLITEGGNPDAAYRIARCLQPTFPPTFPR
jgi:membrane-bound ClpP family serine protease